ncbi:transposase, partial [Candidatus Uhrbacteria bacterium]|nr:transposase [Candidatus Uhrbacteria bacterium]
MSRLANFFAPEEFYHIYNRGTEKRLIFLDNNDRDRFLSLLYLCNSRSPIHRSNFINTSLSDLMTIPRKEPLVDVGAYCLMPNHFHLLLRERIEGGISIFIQKVSTAYAMYFNKRYERNGSLFQGRFKAEHLASDGYLKYIFAYIHLNPISIVDKSWKDHKLKNKTKAEKYLNSYQFSSYLDYINKTSRNPEGNIINKSAFPRYFLTPKDFK